MPSLGSKYMYSRIAFAAEAVPRTPLGSFQRYPGPLAGFGEPLCGREEKEGNTRR